MSATQPPMGATPLLARGSRPRAACPDAVAPRALSSRSDGEHCQACCPAVPEPTMSRGRGRVIRRGLTRIGTGLAAKVVSSLIAAYVLTRLDFGKVIDILVKVMGATT